MKRMTLTPELTEALCTFCSDVEEMEVRVDLLECVENHYIEEDTDNPAGTLDTLKALRSLKQEMTAILRAMQEGGAV